MDDTSYQELCARLQLYCGSTEGQINQENEKEMARWMLRYAKNGQPVTLPELQGMFPKPTKRSLRRLHAIFYLV